MFLKAFLNDYTNMVKTSNDLDRLKFAPQRVEAGVFYNFKNEDMFKGAVQGLETLNIELIPADRVNETSRFTGALQRDYFAGFDKMMEQITKLPGGKYTTDAVADEPVEVTLDDKILEIVKSGDKKAFRAMRQEIKDQWFALNDDDVADAIMDLGDAVSDKDVDYAKEILDGLPGNEPVKKETPADTVVVEEDENAELTDEEAEIIEDIKSAIDDGDEKDFKELIAELKEINADLAKEWSTAFVAAPADDKDEEEGTDVVDEIVEDLEAALEDGDMEEAKECLEELKDEVGEDSDLYKEYAQKLKELMSKVAPKKERRSRRGK